MFAGRSFKPGAVFNFTWRNLAFGAVWGSIDVVLYQYVGLTFLKIPWAPLSLVGIALAFFTGFKNNSAYDRLWEARKVWGAVVNSSRSWGTTVKHFVTLQFAMNENKPGAEEVKAAHKELIYRHIAWLYILRHQLLKPTSWEHVSSVIKSHRKMSEQWRTELLAQFEGEITIEERLKSFINEAEIKKLLAHKNGATQIIDLQSKVLQELREKHLIEDFRHMELQKILNDFYVHQGKLERIKKFPFPRQYASASFYFIGLFILLLPFGIIPETLDLKDAGEWVVWTTMPFTAMIAWVFGLMEMVGDYSENPFEGLANDIPMLSLVRTIEIDLREMLGETELPAPIVANERQVIM